MEHWEIWDIIGARIHHETLTESEEKDFQTWLSLEVENQQIYARLEEFYDNNSGLGKGDPKQYWQENQRRFRLRKRTGLRRIYRYVAYAAVLVLVFCTSIYLLVSPIDSEKQPESLQIAILPGSPKASLTLASGEKFTLQQNDTIICEESGRILNENNRLEYTSAEIIKPRSVLEYNTLEIPRGGEYRLKLADGTLVWLNAETTLRYPVVFGTSERRIYLKGEAYFQVAKDPQHPFIVTVNGVDITALGTEFNILTTEKDKTVYTTLVEGSVRVQEKRGEACVLKPAEQAICRKDAGKMEVRKVKTQLFTSWKDGYYTFEQQPLEKIMATLARWYDIQVFYQNQEVAQLRFSGRLKRYEDITNLLTMIKLTNDVNFEIKGKTIVIKNGINRK